jgi:hypothetical protein
VVPLATAIDAFTTRSDPGVLPRLNVLLGTLNPPPTTAPAPAPAPDNSTTATGVHERLRPEYTRDTALPDRITTYATTGHLPTDGTWRSHSEARQSVLAHAALHGHSLATIRALMAAGRPWHTGLAAAYSRYGHSANNALNRDWRKALTWAGAHSPLFRPVRAQEQVHPGGEHRAPAYIGSGWRTQWRGWKRNSRVTGSDGLGRPSTKRWQYRLCGAER